MKLGKTTISLLLAMAWFVALPLTANAHFPWLVSQTDGGKATAIQVYFGEDASPDDPKLLSRLQGMKVWQLEAGKKPVEMTPLATDGSLSVSIPEGSSADAIYFAQHDLGVLSRGEATFRLRYYAKTGPNAANAAWTKAETTKHLQLDIVPTIVDGKLHVQVLFDGKPAVKAEVKTLGPGLDSFEGVTDENGKVAIATQAAGICSLRARHIETAAGEVDGKKYDEVRHYCTIALPLDAVKKTTPTATTTTAASAKASSKIAPLAEPVTSFGAAIAGDQLYVYGGHTGGAHSYSNKEQGRRLLQANIHGGEWQQGVEGPALQGLALVAHGGKLYRVGGFTAMNAAGEEHNLQSQDSVAMYDPTTKHWTDLPALPEPRSSHDAAVLGDSIYVVGGWNLAAAKEDEKWHKTAWKLDLTKSKPEWEALPEPPFQRRALSLAAHEGKLYVNGGMPQEGGPTTRVDILDPATGKWSQGPNLVGKEGMTGFGNSAFATGGHLYVSTINGDLQRLSDDGRQWEVVKQLPTARFFHRMLPVDDHHLLMVGGASMKIGKFADVEIIDVR